MPVILNLGRKQDTHGNTWRFGFQISYFSNDGDESKYIDKYKRYENDDDSDDKDEPKYIDKYKQYENDCEVQISYFSNRK